MTIQGRLHSRTIRHVPVGAGSDLERQIGIESGARPHLRLVRFVYDTAVSDIAVDPNSSSAPHRA
jgi:hypothetical protein